MDGSGKPRIMIIDDNVTNLNIARMALGERYDVILMPSGEKALKLFERMTPDLILLDVDMPGMDGFEVLRRIKQSPAPVRDVPVIFLTAKDDGGSACEGLSFGAADYIAKPFSFPLLLKRVELHLELASRREKGCACRGDADRAVEQPNANDDSSDLRHSTRGREDAP